MKRITTGIVLMCAACTWGQSIPINASAAEGKVIDGKTDDWTTGPLRYFDSNLKLSYDIANDQNNIYMVFQMDHDLGMMQLLHAALQVQLEPTGKNKRKTLIAFSDIKPPSMEKMGPPPSDSMAMGMPRDFSFPGGGKGKLNLPADFLKQADLRFETAGFVSDNGEHTFSDSLPIHAACNLDAQGNLTYELVIPLAELAKSPSTTPSLLSKKMNLDLSMVVFQQPGPGGMPPPSDDMQGPPSGMGSGGMGGGMGGGMQGPPGGMGSGGMGGGMGGGRPSGPPQGANAPQGGKGNAGAISQSRQSVKRKLQLKKDS